MEIKKLLYVTHLKEPTPELLDGFLIIKKIGLKEIILVCESIPHALEDRLSENGINLKLVSTPDPLVSGVLDITERESPSLVVAHFPREKGNFVGRQVVKNLIKRTKVPLLITYENSAGTGSFAEGLFDRLILATDWSDSARRTWLYIIGIKDIVGSVDIVYVLNERPTIGEIRQLRKRVEGVRRICLEEEMDAESHIYAGKVAEEILLASRDYGSTLIAMGHKARGPFKEIFTKTTCHKIAEESPLPVLIIP